jgi:hypothetical protein
MSEQTMKLAREGFGAWQRGDFDTLEAMLDPGVRWHWFEPGEWDCHSRDDVNCMESASGWIWTTPLLVAVATPLRRHRDGHRTKVPLRSRGSQR